MPRLVGVDIPKEKRIELSLTYVYGIGRTLSNKILKVANISPDKRAKDLTEEEVARLSSIIQKEYKVEGDLRRDISANIKRLIDVGAYRGLRTGKAFPCAARGQKHTQGQEKDLGRRSVSRELKLKSLLLNKPERATSGAEKK